LPSPSFDLVYQDGWDLTRAALEDRKGLRGLQEPGISAVSG
jgi:ATP-dependent DNA ligase